MTTTELSPFMWKDGYRIERRMIEQFCPWCAICKAPIGTGIDGLGWTANLEAAKAALCHHASLFHGLNLLNQNVE